METAGRGPSRPCPPYSIVCVGGDGMFSEALHGLVGSTQRRAGVDQNEPGTALVPSRLRIGIIPAGRTWPPSSRHLGHRHADFPAESLFKRGTCGATANLKAGSRGWVRSPAAGPVGPCGEGRRPRGSPSRCQNSERGSREVFRPGGAERPSVRQGGGGGAGLATPGDRAGSRRRRLGVLCSFL